MAKKNFQTNNGSKSNNFQTDTRTEDLVLAESTFLLPEKEDNVTDEEIKSAVVLPGGVTNIDFMMPEEEREILEKNINVYSDMEKMQKVLNVAKRNKILSEDLKTLDVISKIDGFNDRMFELLASEETLEVLEENLRKQLTEEGGDASKSIKNVGMTVKAMLDARETILNKLKAGKSGKKAKIALKFTNDSGEEFQLGADLDV